MSTTPQTQHGRARLLPIAAAAALLTVPALVWLPRGVVWATAIWLGICIAGVLLPGSPRRRGISLNAGLLLLVFGALEVYWGMGPEIRDEGSDLADYIGPHEILGYAPTPGHETTIVRHGDDALIYDVTYTIGENGLRVAPPVTDENAACVLFFGGSFTFGEGLENDEALAWQVGVLSGGRYRVHNFGFHGYGPHQMLAAIQQGIVDDAIACRPRFVVYQAGEFHVSRAAGLSTWEQGGPRFEVVTDERVEYRGRWDEDRFRHPDWLVRAGAASKVVGKLLGLHRPTNAGDVARFLAIVETTRSEVAARYPGAELVVVYWDAPDDPIAGDLESRGLRVRRVGEILPDRLSAPEKYRLHELDGHPNARAMSAIAQDLVETLDGDDAHTR